MRQSENVQVGPPTPAQIVSFTPNCRMRRRQWRLVLSAQVDSEDRRQDDRLSDESADPAMIRTR
jgi:hypothetical protein